MRVYVVIYSHYDDYTVHGVFLNEDQANRFAETMYRCSVVAYDTLDDIEYLPTQYVTVTASNYEGNIMENIDISVRRTNNYVTPEDCTRPIHTLCYSDCIYVTYKKQLQQSNEEIIDDIKSVTHDMVSMAEKLYNSGVTLNDVIDKYLNMKYGEWLYEKSTTS